MNTVKELDYTQLKRICSSLLFWICLNYKGNKKLWFSKIPICRDCVFVWNCFISHINCIFF